MDDDFVAGVKIFCSAVLFIVTLGFAYNYDQNAKQREIEYVKLELYKQCLDTIAKANPDMKPTASTIYCR